ELLPGPTREEICKMIIRHGALQMEHKGEVVAMREMRGHMAWYTAGLPHSAKLRNDINQVGTMDELCRFVEDRMAGIQPEK
uniref:tRNA-dihydrouridine synthase n=1 Tax=Lacrimispora sp. TaxID=2719234 RepID=UPI0028A9202B